MSVRLRVTLAIMHLYEHSLSNKCCVLALVQWGDGFPARWIWAEGQEYISSPDSTSSDPFCGGDAGEFLLQAFLPCILSVCTWASLVREG